MTDQPTRSPAAKGPGRRFRDLATLLPVLGILLLATPVVSIFTKSGTIFGLPSPFFYVFGVWAGLILLAFAMARRAQKRKQ